jgi:replication factor A1
MDQRNNTITPISGITGGQYEVTIVGRVTSKTALRDCPEDEADCHVFSFDIQDQTGEIRVVAFDELAGVAFLEIDVDKVYRISSVSVRLANKYFAALKHKYELVLNPGSMIEALADDKSLPAIQYNFQKLTYVTSKNAEKPVDVVAVIKEIGDLDPTSQGWVKREITLIDETGEAVLTLWKNDAKYFSGNERDSVIIRKAKVSDTYIFPYLKSSSSFSIEFNADSALVYPVLGWYVTQQRRDVDGSIADESGYWE